MADGTSREPIAIVGMAGRFPGARDIDEFWANLRAGKESISRFSADELRASGVDAAKLQDAGYVAAKGYLEAAEQFDASFFGLSARQAEILDPQQRIFLEVAAEALESAGCDPHRSSDAIGIFGGASLNTYLLFNLYPNEDLVGVMGWPQVFSANRTDHLTTRVAYMLDLHGPAVTVQCACSTSLVAVHLACMALMQGECDVALAGGVSVIMPRKAGYIYQEGGILSPDGHCRAFDSAARGTVPGEGAGVVVLKPLREALADGDTIHAIIKGSAINNDGSLKIGYTAPSADGQAAAIAEAQIVAGVHPDSVSYIEAHGTGTPLGDPIEISALTRVFRRGTRRKAFCGIGSVKTNIGHLDAAAGVSGLIKTVLAMRHRELPPSLHFERGNPEIDFASSPFYVNRELRAWTIADDQPRRAGVSSFGIGGTNCHVVLEEAPPSQPALTSRATQLVLLSARSASSLDAATNRLALAMREREHVHLPDVAFTLAVGRRQHPHRRALACSDVAECTTLLTKLDPSRVFTGEAQDGTAEGVVFLFPGQGSQHTGMARELYRTERTFREALDRCFAAIEEQLGEDPRPVIWDPSRREQLRQTQWAQCALFAVEWSLAQLWQHWGIRALNMLGHSIGEYVAACLAGLFDVEDGLSVVATRGRLMQQQPPGSMLAVHLAEEDVLLRLRQLDPEAARLSLAAVNGQSSCVVSGHSELVNVLEDELTERGAQCRRLKVSHAFHSAMMDPILDEFREVVASSHLKSPSSLWISNVTGRRITGPEAMDPNYWVRQLRGTVRFSDGLARILEESSAPLLEVGPGQVLRGLARWRPDKRPGQAVLSSLPSEDGKVSDNLHLQTTLGRLWVAGLTLNRDRYFEDEQRRRIELPTYSFDHKRYWVSAPVGASREASTTHERRPFERWFYAPAWHRAPWPNAASVPAESERCNWLILADRIGIADRLADRIRKRGDAVAVYYPKNLEGVVDRDRLVVGGTARDYRALLDDLAGRELMPQRILHLATLGACAGGDCDNEAAFTSAFENLLHLGQALSSKISSPVQLIVASDGIHDVTGSERLMPQHAAILGPCRVLPQEDQRIVCRNVDFAVPSSPESGVLERISDQLLAESLATDRQRAVAYRGEDRWLEEYTEVALPISGAGSVIRPGGAYVITGGLGGIGLEIAEVIAEAGQTKIALIGRTSLPARDEWAGILTQSAIDTRDSRRIKRVLELEKRADLLLLTADVSDRGQMAIAMKRIRERFGQIHGVVHSAGVAEGGIVQLKTDAAAAAVLAAKIRGTNVLRETLVEIGFASGLDFLAMCSARGSLLGGFGQVAYTAANAYLDALAHKLARDSKTHVVAIDWPAWKQVGMLADAIRAQRGSAVAQVGDAVNHPLLDRHVKHGDGKSDFFTKFSPASHWILDEHRITGSPVLPGTAYVEAARAAAQVLLRGGDFELRDVFFLAPIVVRDGQSRELRVSFVPDEKGGFRFSFAGAPPNRVAGRAEWRDVCTGDVRPVERSEAPVHDLRAWIARCSRREITHTSESEIRDDNGPRWRSLRTIHLGDRELVARFELPETFAGDLEWFALHPALLDRVNLTGREYLAETFASRNFYLPFSYGKVLVRAPLPRAFWAYSRLKTAANDSGATITFDTVIIDESGRELVNIVDFGQKRVVDVADQLRAFTRGEATDDVADAPSPDRGDPYGRAMRSGISAEEGRAAFRCILGSRGLPQVVVSPTDVAKELDALAELRVEGRLNETSETSRAKQERHGRPDLSTPYRAPRTNAERSLIEAWQELLGIEPIGVDDNFFELGGDSVQGIQLVMHCRKIGLEISQQQVFEHQTVAALAAVVEGSPHAPDAPRPLAPAHRLLLDGRAPGHAIVLRYRAGSIDASRLSVALDALTRQHDNLRLRFDAAASGRARVRESAAGDVPVRIAELSATDTDADIAWLRGELACMLDPRDGPVICAAVATRGGQPSELLLAIHEVATDPASVHVLLDHLGAAYASAGKSDVEGRSATFDEWLTGLQQPMGEGDVVEVPADLQEAQPAVDDMVPAHSPVHLERKIARLELHETEQLLQLSGKHRVSVEELLIGCLARGVRARHETGTVAVELQRSLRGESLGGLDLSRTVGPLYCAMPLVLRVLALDATEEQRWRHIKDVIRPMLRDAWRAHVLRERYFARKPHLAPPKAPRPDLLAAYYGELKHTAFGEALSDVHWEPTSDAQIHAPTMRAFVLDGTLRMHWEYDAARHRSETIVSWARGVVDEIRSVLETGRAQTVDLGPADFPMMKLDERSFGRVANALRKLDDGEQTSAVSK